MTPALAAILLTARLFLFFGLAGLRIWLLLSDWSRPLTRRGRRRPA